MTFRCFWLSMMLPVLLQLRMSAHGTAVAWSNARWRWNAVKTKG